MRIYDLPPSWSPDKFASRYSLDRNKDFYVDANGKLVVFPTLLDDPPIFETPDPFVPAPAGIHVHTMKQAEGKFGGKFIASEIDSNCIHVVLDTESQLNDPWLTSIPMDAGSAAYCKDTGKQWLWNGTEWKKP